MGIENLDSNIKGFNLLKELYQTNQEFRAVLDKGIQLGHIRFFGEEEFEKMRLQNYISPTPDANTLEDMYIMGYNIGDCKGMSYQLSYSYNNVDIVTGINHFLIGTKNSQQGGHLWLETKTEIIDTSLMILISVSYKNEMRYQEEYRITSQDLKKSQMYQSRKEWTNDPYINLKK